MNEQYTEIKETGGKGWFYFSLIPAALAGALLMYFSFYTGLIDWQKAQRIEGRMDNRVGVNGQLKAPVELIMVKKSCLIVERAYLDGTAGTMYLTNKCNAHLRYIAWHWNAVAPDGTIIESDYSNSTDGFSAGDKLEKTFAVPDDPRIAKVIVWGEGTPY